MVLIALKCPNCGGEVQMEENMKSGFCVHCGSKIINEQNVGGIVSIDKGSDLVNGLKVAKEALMVHDWETTTKLVDNIMLMDPDCKDAWNMKLLLNYRDETAYNNIVSRMECKELKDYGIFSEDDIKQCWGKFDLFISLRHFTPSPPKSFGFSKKQKEIISSVYPSSGIPYCASIIIDGKKPFFVESGTRTVFGIDPGMHEISVEIGTTSMGGMYAYARPIKQTFVASTSGHEFEIVSEGTTTPTGCKLIQNK